MNGRQERFSVGPTAHEILSGEQIRAEVEREVLGVGFFDKARKMFNGDSDVQAEYEKRLNDDAARMTEGLQLREHGGVPYSLYANASHDQMKELLDGNANSATIAASSEKWIEIGNQLARFQSRTADTIAHSEPVWHGDAADAMRQFFAQLGQWSGDAARGAQLTGKQQQVQSQSLNETQKKMPEPVPWSPREETAQLQQITDPVAYARAADAMNGRWRMFESNQQEAARLMTEFDRTLGQAAVVPAFPSPPQLGGNTFVPPKPQSTGHTGPIDVPQIAPGRIDRPGTPGKTAVTTVDVPGIAPGQRPEIGGHEPFRPTAPGSGEPSPGDPADQPGSRREQTTTAGAAPVFDTTPGISALDRDPGRGPGVSTGAGGTFGPGAPDGTPRTGSGGRSSSGSGGSPAGGRAGGGALAGGRATGTGSGAVPGHGAGGRAGAGASTGGKSGAGGVPFGPLGGRGREEDKERERPSYLLEQDTTGIFESDEQVVPPVIGERPS
ncbi:PPE domain-containing protein [Amycolatopsis nigrescens]|uniref:PPE domain-containing protein n=1 Tax=Amycolatopsis nigrescens TaxID=381445 RepID=UPI000369353F|nr:PPE domain-containing protein [Amycolatopsis nigrescens]